MKQTNSYCMDFEEIWFDSLKSLAGLKRGILLGRTEEKNYEERRK